MDGVKIQLPWGNLDEIKKRGNEFALASNINGQPSSINSTVQGNSFSSVLTSKIQEASDVVTNAQKLNMDFLLDPESVDPHDVTIGLAKANMTVNLTQNIVSSLVKAYREITTLR